jgi:hypothetical protein
MEQTKYTVFYQGGFLTDGNCGCHALEDFLTAEVIGGMPPVAWAPVCYWDWARENPGRDCDVLRAESIAAGRTIELIDGKYVPRGVPVEDKPAKQDTDALFRAVQHLAALVPRTTQPTKERTRPALDWNKPTPFDAFGGFFTEPADMADWQDTYYPR